jgi:hypothetical protein
MTVATNCFFDNQFRRTPYKYFDIVFGYDKMIEHYNKIM